MNLRNEVTKLIARAMESSSDDPQSKHNLNQITTDRIISAIAESLPEPVDTDAKYETTREGGIWVTMNTEDERENKRNFELAQAFAEDVGWNKFRYMYTDYLQGLYRTDATMLQSDHGKNYHQDRHGDEEADQSDHPQPSQIS